MERRGRGKKTQTHTPQYQKAAMSQHLNSHSHSRLLFPSHASTLPVEVAYNPQNSGRGQQREEGKVQFNRTYSLGMELELYVNPILSTFEKINFYLSWIYIAARVQTFLQFAATTQSCSRDWGEQLHLALAELELSARLLRYSPQSKENSVTSQPLQSPDSFEHSLK